MAELFATSVPNINTHIANVLQDKELDENSVIKDYLITAADGVSFIVFNILLSEISEQLDLLHKKSLEGILGIEL